MSAAPTAPAPAGALRPSWGGVADAVGHCLLVFAFLPALGALPAWIGFEAQNVLNRTDPIVLAFVPLRGVLTLLDGFTAGLAPRLIAGMLTGALLWSASGLARGATLRRVALGALAGTVGAGVASVVPLAVPSASDASLAFALGGGAVCGALAAPGAYRLLAATSASASHQ